VKNKGFALILEDEKPDKQTGFWKKSELQTLKEGITNGCDWHAISKRIPSRSWSQVVRKGKHLIDNGEIEGFITPTFSSNTTVSSEGLDNFDLNRGAGEKQAQEGLVGVVVGPGGTI
jgi:hypothetical protein